MNRTRDYYRKMRAKHIKRKKGITAKYRLSSEFPFYRHEGMYSKGKIHCSCPLCKEKAYYQKHVKTMQEKRHAMTDAEIQDEIDSVGENE